MKTLDMLIAAMSEAALHEKELCMTSYYTRGNPSKGTTVDNCNSVLGFGALYYGDCESFENEAGRMWNRLQDEIGDSLAGSIVDATAGGRLYSATIYCEAKGWPTGWLKEQKHLHTDSSAQDALSYMLAVRERIERTAL